MFEKNMTANAHQWIEYHLSMLRKNTLTAIDATMGNGYDFAFLAEQDKINTLIGFDIQVPACISSYIRVLNTKKTVRLVLDSHHHMNQYVEKADIIMFNLGYLPNGEKQIVTKCDTTIEAVKQAMQLLTVGGLMTIMTYPGHEEGLIEHKAIQKIINSNNNQQILCFEVAQLGTKNPCPHLFLAKKLK